MSKDRYNSSYDDDWSKGPRDRKDKPGKKHNNNNHQVDVMAEKKKPVKTPVKFKRHSDCDDED